jgi:response regulator RpfG family c-di-GMP phosphodiesterase
MQAGQVYYTGDEGLGNSSRGKILLIDDDAKALEAYSASLRREGHEVHAFASLPEGLSCLESEHFDLIMVKLKELPDSANEEFWTVRSRSKLAGPSCIWNAATAGFVTWMWRTWEHRTN